MSSRLSATDTEADRALRAILDTGKSRGFLVIAGAGSGKTTSLVKALDHVARTRGQSQLDARTQQIACITYTSVAAEEIAADVGHNPIVAVSTIHSFLWALVRPFHNDIRAWLDQELRRRVEALTAKQAAYSTRTQARTIAKGDEEMRRLRHQINAVASADRFRYGHGTDYSTGSFGHEDLMKMATELIIDKPLLARIAACKYPYIFVDESQDTFPEVVDALKHVHAKSDGEVCLGFFGDPMQQIYQRGVGAITAEPGWASIGKPENFRSSRQVLRVVNIVRSKADGLVQTPGRPDEQPEGEFFVFVLPADEHRNANLALARRWLSRNSSAGDWTTDSDPDGKAAKILIIVHRMAAARLGFSRLYAAFNDNRDTALGTSFREGVAWPLRPFDELLLPLCDPDAVDDPALVTVVRDKLACTLTCAGVDARKALKRTRAQVERIRTLMHDGGPGSVGAVLRCAMECGLYEPDPGFATILKGHSGVESSDPESATLEAFLACDAAEVARYFRYIRKQSPYSTQHGTKGSEFAKVLVILDDEEGAPFKLYSYEKLFGIRALSDGDLKHQAAGEDSVLERTRRLLYVCVSRAVESLAIVIFAHDIAAARTAVEKELLGNRTALTLQDIAVESDTGM